MGKNKIKEKAVEVINEKQAEKVEKLADKEIANKERQGTVVTNERQQGGANEWQQGTVVTNERQQGQSKQSFFQKVIDGSFIKDLLIHNLALTFYIAMLTALYIANTYYAENTLRQIERAKAELKEMRYEFITKKSELINRSRQSEIAKKLESKYIKESIVPPYKIIDE